MKLDFLAVIKALIRKCKQLIARNNYRRCIDKIKPPVEFKRIRKRLHSLLVTKKMLNDIFFDFNYILLLSLSTGPMFIR